MSGGSERVRVVVADDHPCVAELLERFLAVRDLEVVASASDGPTALEAILEHRPDVAVVDLRLPGLGGIAVAERVAEAGLSTAILVFTAYASHGAVAEAVRVGVRGFVDKGSSLDELARAIRTVARGETYIDSGVEPALRLRGTIGTPLTARERDVLRRTSTGMTSRQIGAELALSPSTVRAHLRNATRKLGARNGTHAVVEALRYSLIN